MHVCMSVCTRSHVYACMHPCVCVCVCECVRVRTHVCVYERRESMYVIVQ